MIRKVGKKYYLYSKTGKKILSRHSSKTAAQKRERQINYFKHLAKRKRR